MAKITFGLETVPGFGEHYQPNQDFDRYRDPNSKDPRATPAGTDSNATPLSEKAPAFSKRKLAEQKKNEIKAKQPYYDIFNGVQLSREPKKRDFADFMAIFNE